MSNTYDPSLNPRDPNFAGPCPRCGGPVPDAEHPGQGPAALSRYDSRTYICSACGVAEALKGGHLVPFDVDLDSEEAHEIRVAARAMGAPSAGRADR